MDDAADQVPCHRDQLLHQMGQARIIGHYHGEKCLKILLETMESNLITTHSKIFANSWGLRTITPPPLPTFRPTDKLRLQTDPYSR